MYAFSAHGPIEFIDSVLASVYAFSTHGPIQFTAFSQELIHGGGS